MYSCRMIQTDDQLTVADNPPLILGPFLELVFHFRLLPFARRNLFVWVFCFSFNPRLTPGGSMS